MSRSTRNALLVLTLAFFFSAETLLHAAPRKQANLFVDLSLLVAPEYPCTWPAGFPAFGILPQTTIGKDSPYNTDLLIIDGNTGTQLDTPPHSVARPETGFPHAGPLGLQYADKVPVWRLVGEACVIDIHKFRNKAKKGYSALIEESHIKAWEDKHRPLCPGDVAMFHSGYSDKYYRPLPDGSRFVAKPLSKKSPAWPNPSPEGMAYLASRGITAVGTDSPSMGPLPDLAEATHYAGLKEGLVFTEGAMQLGKLSKTGAFFAMLAMKHAMGPYAEGRAIAIRKSELAGRLIESVKAKRVIDLSVTLDMNLPVTWPGKGIGNHRHPYTKADFLYSEHLDLYHHTHLMDAHAGTHLVPPSFALPSPGFSNSQYSERIRKWLADYEEDFGARGFSDVTAEKVPLAQTCGPARVIDVTGLSASFKFKPGNPRSPLIIPVHIRKYEKEYGRLGAGDIVIFKTGYTGRTFKPMPEGAACVADPLNGKSAGWPALSARTVIILAKRGIRCVAIDAPTITSVNPKNALFTYWALGSHNMVAVEFLINVAALPDKSYFLFAPIKIRDCHGGPGRAIALH